MVAESLDVTEENVTSAMRKHVNAMVEHVGKKTVGARNVMVDIALPIRHLQKVVYRLLVLEPRRRARRPHMEGSAVLHMGRRKIARPLKMVLVRLAARLRIVMVENAINETPKIAIVMGGIVGRKDAIAQAVMADLVVPETTHRRDV